MSLVRYDAAGTVAVLTIDQPPRNCIDHPLRRSLLESIDRAAADTGFAAIVLTGADDGFSAGADLRELGTPSAASEPTLGTLVDAIESARKPVIAAVHGMCFGAGLELVLACAFRVASPNAKFAFPEATRGLVPGVGGTQRLPRLVGVEAALSLVLSGEPAGVERFFGTGLLDAIIEGDLVAGAVAFAERIVAEARPIARARDRAIVFPKADAFFHFVRTNALGDDPTTSSARRRCVDAVEAAVREPFPAGHAAPTCSEQFLASPESRAARHVFLAERAASKIPGLPRDIPARSVRRVAVVGAGTMGAGIAMSFLSTGIPVSLIDAEQGALDRAVERVRSAYRTSVEKGRMSSQNAERALLLLEPTLDYAGAAGAELFIEAVFEDLAVKEKVWRRIDEVAKPGAVLATNTSTLDIDRIAAFTGRRRDVLGMHFFSPAHVMKLLEVVRGAATADDVLVTAMAVAKTIGKTAVVSRVCDGFIGNRLLQAYLRQAFFLLEEGALPGQVDGALERFGMAMGPFRVGDLAGNDIGWAIRKRLRVERPDRPYSGIPDRLCERGRFGQKCGQGWYRYDQGSRSPVVDPEVTRLIEDYRTERGITPRRVADDEVVERCVLALVNEGARVLDEGVAIRASDIDLVYLTGYGFPAARGGPMFYADTLGLYRVARTLRRFAAEPKASPRGDTLFWTPARLLEHLATDGGTFHGRDGE